ncbi:MAG: nicotinate (nicotinamide) nucleotide adenylyltransferase [Breznakibacter sp.]
MAHVGLLFGSFNPVHVGHLTLANYMLVTQDLDEVWLVVSPQNPFKTEMSLIDGRHRLKMVEIALDDHPDIKACDIELNLPVPSYTTDTLDVLKSVYPRHRFSIIMGADNVLMVGRWKDAQKIKDNHTIFVYPRPGSPTGNVPLHHGIVLTEAPLFEISSTFVRQLLAGNKDVSFFVPAGVAKYIRSNRLYK